MSLDPADLASRISPDPGPGRLDQLLALAQVADCDTFVGQGIPTSWRRLYGGQILGQAVIAAARTVPATLFVHSLHAYFLLAGDSRTEILYNVERVHSGGSFHRRRVVAVQARREIFSLVVSFHKDEDGPRYQIPATDIMSYLRVRDLGLGGSGEGSGEGGGGDGGGYSGGGSNSSSGGSNSSSGGGGESSAASESSTDSARTTGVTTGGGSNGGRIALRDLGIGGSNGGGIGGGEGTGGLREDAFAAIAAGGPGAGGSGGGEGFTAGPKVVRLATPLELIKAGTPIVRDHVAGTCVSLAVGSGERWSLVWRKHECHLGEEATWADHAAIVAFMSDQGTVATVRRPHEARGHTFASSTSLDHSMHFHRRFRCDEWLLYHQETTVSAGGRGLVTMQVFTQHGELMATVNQECLIRLGRKAGKKGGKGDTETKGKGKGKGHGGAGGGGEESKGKGERSNGRGGGAARRPAGTARL